MPVVLLEKTVENPNGGLTILHCAIMKESNGIYGTGDDRFIKLKNSSEKEPELEIKLNMNTNQNGWKLSSPDCIYIKLDSSSTCCRNFKRSNSKIFEINQISQKLTETIGYRYKLSALDRNDFTTTYVRTLFISKIISF